MNAIDRSNPMQGDSFHYYPTQGGVITVTATSMQRLEIDPSNGPTPTCSYTSKDYKCLGKGKNSEIDLLYKDWWGKCGGCLEKMFHIDCFVNFIHTKNKYNLLCNGITHLACGLKCSKKKSESLISPPAQGDNSERLSWLNDGPNDSINSMSILLDWLSTEPNYSKYRGSDDDKSLMEGGKSKIQYCADISELIASNGIKAKRTADAVKNKIADIHRKWTKAHDWTQATGSGVTNETDFKAGVLHRCEYYYTLLDVFSAQGNADGFTNERGAINDDQVVQDSHYFLEYDDDDDDDELVTSIGSVSNTGTSMSTNSTGSVTAYATATSSASLLNSTPITTRNDSNIQETPTTSNVRKKMSLVELTSSTKKKKKLSDGIFPEHDFFDRKIALQQEQIAIERRKLVLNEEKAKREMQMQELDIIDKKEELKMNHYIRLKKAVDIGVYESMDQAMASNPLNAWATKVEKATDIIVIDDKKKVTGT